MTQFPSRRGRLPAFALLIALFASADPDVERARRGHGHRGPAAAGISVDTFGTGTYTTLTGPSITEGLAGRLGIGTIELDLPAGFQYNTAVGNVT